MSRAHFILTKLSSLLEVSLSQGVGKRGRPLTFFFGHFLVTFFSFLVTSKPLGNNIFVLGCFFAYPFCLPPFAAQCLKISSPDGNPEFFNLWVLWEIKWVQSPKIAQSQKNCCACTRNRNVSVFQNESVFVKQSKCQPNDSSNELCGRGEAFKGKRGEGWLSVMKTFAAPSRPPSPCLPFLLSSHVKRFPTSLANQSA